MQTEAVSIEPHQNTFIWCGCLRYEIQRLLSAVGNTIGDFDQQLINVTESRELKNGTTRLKCEVRGRDRARLQ